MNAKEREWRGGGGRENGDFFGIWTAREPTGIFSALAHRGRPLASRPRKGVGTARIVREVSPSENLPVISAQQPRQIPQEILCIHVLRTADGIARADCVILWPVPLVPPFGTKAAAPIGRSYNRSVHLVRRLQGAGMGVRPLLYSNETGGESDRWG